MLHSIWRYAERNNFTEHEDATIYGLTSGNKPLKARLWFMEAELQLSSSGLGQDTRMKTFMSLMAALHLTSHCPVKLSQRVYADPVLMSRWDVTTQPQEKAAGERQCKPGTVTWIMTCRYIVCLGLLSTGNRPGKCPHSCGLTLLRQIDVNVTAVLKIFPVLQLSWGYQVILSPQSWQCRSWSGWRPFCSGGSETFGTTQSLCVNLSCCCPEGLLPLASWKDPQVLLFLWLLLGCLLHWWRGREGEEVTASFIQTF